MTDRKKVYIDPAYCEVKLQWINQKIELCIYDSIKYGRKKHPVYVMELEPYMASHLAAACVKGLNLAKQSIEKEIRGVIDAALERDDDG